MDIMRQFACLVVNSIMVDTYDFLFNCMMVGQASDLIMALPDACRWLGPP